MLRQLSTSQRINHFNLRKPSEKNAWKNKSLKPITLKTMSDGSPLTASQKRESKNQAYVHYIAEKTLHPVTRPTSRILKQAFLDSPFHKSLSSYAIP